MSLIKRSEKFFCCYFEKVFIFLLLLFDTILQTTTKSLSRGMMFVATKEMKRSKMFKWREREVVAWWVGKTEKEMKVIAQTIFSLNDDAH
jgi:hypothetical protein